MTDREKLTAIVEAVCENWRETNKSLIIYDSMTKIMFEENGEVRSIIRGHIVYGPDGERSRSPGVNLRDGEM
jgi:archaellum biogenesis ATPase FlaH